MKRVYKDEIIERKEFLKIWDNYKKRVYKRWDNNDLIIIIIL